MPFTIEGKNTTHEFVITSDIKISMHADIIVELVRLIAKYDNVAGVSTIEFNIRAGTDPAEYDYAVISDNGRQWTQVITFDAPKNPLQTFVTDAWRLSEFRLQREIRLALIELVNEYGMTKMEFTYY